MQFADFYAVTAEGADGVARFLEFDREMAGVVVDAEVFIQTRIVRMFGAQALKKSNRLRAGLKPAEWLRFHAEVQGPPRGAADAINVFDAAPEIVADGLLLLGAGDESFERAGQGAHAAFDAGWDELREQVKQTIRICQALGRSPIREVNLLLPARAVESPERKSVDRKNVAVLLLQPFLKLFQDCGV